MIPDAIMRFMSADQLAQFFKRFAGLNGWRRSTVGDRLTWQYANKSGSVAFAFSRSTGHLVAWQIKGAATTSWKLEYPAIGALPPLTIPSDAVLVESFRLPPARPKTADPVARQIVNACFDAYEKAFRFRATIVVDGARYGLWRNGGTVEEVGPAGGWRWSRGILTLWPKSGGIFQGQTKASVTYRYLAQLHIDTEPLALIVLNDDNYAGRLFTPEYAIKKVGSVVLRGEKLSLLRVTGPAVRFDLQIDGSGLIRQIDSTAYDGSGRRLTETVRQIAYAPFGAPAAPPSKRPSPLPKLKPLPKPPPLP